MVSRFMYYIVIRRDASNGLADRCNLYGDANDYSFHLSFFFIFRPPSGYRIFICKFKNKRPLLGVPVYCFTLWRKTYRVKLNPESRIPFLCFRGYFFLNILITVLIKVQRLSWASILIALFERCMHSFIEKVSVSYQWCRVFQIYSKPGFCISVFKQWPARNNAPSWYSKARKFPWAVDFAHMPPQCYLPDSFLIAL